MTGFKLHYLPIITSGWFILTLMITYSLAVSNKHVYPIFPLVSETGTEPPESCIFSQMFNIGAVLVAVSMYVRYRQIDFIIKTNKVNIKKEWNEVAFWLGNISSLGISMVGNFQIKNFLAMHLIGAFLAFGVGGTYFLVQTGFSFELGRLHKKYPQYIDSKNRLRLKVVLISVFFLSWFVMLITLPLAMMNFTGDNQLWWTEEHGGYQLRVVGTIAEWILVIMYVLFGLTPMHEFKALEFEEIKIRSNFEISSNNRKSQ